MFQLTTLLLKFQIFLFQALISQMNNKHKGSGHITQLLHIWLSRLSGVKVHWLSCLLKTMLGNLTLAWQPVRCKKWARGQCVSVRNVYLDLLELLKTWLWVRKHMHVQRVLVWWMSMGSMVVQQWAQCFIEWGLWFDGSSQLACCLSTINRKHTHLLACPASMDSGILDPEIHIHLHHCVWGGNQNFTFPSRPGFVFEIISVAVRFSTV